MRKIGEVVSENRYPGRGVVWARTRGGALCGGYFLTGRSAASKARVLRRGDGELVVSPTGASAHDPLRHYAAARERGGWLVFGNGEQVGAVADRLEDAAGLPEDAGAGRAADPRQALDGLAYEPDPPIFTPRITVVVRRSSGRAWLGAARRARGGRTSADVMTLAVGELTAGDALVMTTYRSDGGEAVATAEPYAEARTAAAGRSDLLAEVWGALDPGLRVAAAAFVPGELARAAVVRRGR